MNILVFEYITGGGCAGQPLPASLLAEGRLMLSALLDDLSAMSDITVQVMLDKRCQQLAEDYTLIAKVVDDSEAVEPLFQKLLAWADAVWLIAPEFEGILEKYCAWVEQAGKRLLNSNAAAVALTAHKWRTFKALQAAQIPAVFTEQLSTVIAYQPGAWVIKPVAGVGCMDTWLVTNAREWAETLAIIDNVHDYIVQPYLEGANQSLSGLFYQGQARLLCLNRQCVNIQHRQFALEALVVNALPVKAVYQQLLAAIAKAIPGLYGYVGIDIIVRADELLVLEINPRLTSAYVGIYQALGINCAQAVINLDQPLRELKFSRNRAVEVLLK